MELKCADCGQPLWAPAGQATPTGDGSPPSITGGELVPPTPAATEAKPWQPCSTCGTALPLAPTPAGDSEAMARWLPAEPAPVEAVEGRVETEGEKEAEKAAESPFPARLAEPLPDPGYPDQLETRARYRAEIQARHAQILEGRPLPSLLATPPGPLAEALRGPQDPLGSQGPEKPGSGATALAEAAGRALNFPAPKLGTPTPRTDEQAAEKTPESPDMPEPAR